MRKFIWPYSYIVRTLCSLAEADSERCAWLPERQGTGDDWKQGHEAKAPRHGQQLSRPRVKLSVYTGNNTINTKILRIRKVDNVINSYVSNAEYLQKIANVYTFLSHIFTIIYQKRISFINFPYIQYMITGEFNFFFNRKKKMEHSLWWTCPKNVWSTYWRNWKNLGISSMWPWPVPP